MWRKHSAAGGARAHVEVHALAHQGAALLCEEEFGSAPDASSSVEDDDE